MSTPPPGSLDDALRDELEALARDVSRACPPYRMSRRDVAVPAQLPRALRWFWEVFGHSALSQRCAPPDDPGAREAALDMLRDWSSRDVRYDEVAARISDDHRVIAFDDDELVLLAPGLTREDEDPPLVLLRAPTGTSEGPDLEHHASSALRYLVAGVLKGLWSELVRVLLVARPPIEVSQPYPRVAPQVCKGAAAGAAVWVVERPVGDRAGFALYFAHNDAEAVEAWLVREGFADQMMV